MTPRPHQVIGAKWTLDTVRTKGLAYLCWQERTGKTLTALLAVEDSSAKKCLIITKKKAIEGWDDTLAKWKHSTKFTVINYESAHKVLDKFDFIILDESHHAISGFPKSSKTWKSIYKHTKDKPIIYLSATPYAEHLGLIFHQLKLSSWTPFKQRKSYDWFRRYGISKMTRTPYGLVETYSKYKDKEILTILEPYFNFKTRADVGIKQEPSVNVVNVGLNATQDSLIATLIKDDIITIGKNKIVCDSDMKLRMVHYQIEGGTVKLDKGSLWFSSNKLDYVRKNYSPLNTVIMAHFIAEREMMEKYLKGFTILSADGHAEGVDLSMFKKLVVYSMSFRTSKYTQRLARQANHNRTTPIVVDILVADKPAIGKSVYEAVAIKKVNFDKHSYERTI